MVEVTARNKSRLFVLFCQNRLQSGNVPRKRHKISKSNRRVMTSSAVTVHRRNLSCESHETSAQ